MTGTSVSTPEGRIVCRNLSPLIGTRNPGQVPAARPSGNRCGTGGVLTHATPNGTAETARYAATENPDVHD